MALLKQRLPFVNMILKGLGQIMLQNNALTGLLFLTGIFYGLNYLGIAAILAVVCGTLTAKALGYDKEGIQEGLYGFSASLVGVAIIFYFQPVLITWIAIIAGSVMATIIQHWFIVKKIPVFTLPFVLVAWAIIYLFHHSYPVAPSDFLSAKTQTAHDFMFSLRGFGQVIFQGSAFAGIVFFIAVFINSPISALYGIGASILGAALSALFHAPIEGIEAGLFSYNAVLCAIVFAGNKKQDGIWALIAIVLSVFISLVMAKHDLVQLTFPFVAATCITLVIKNLTGKYFHNSLSFS